MTLGDEPQARVKLSGAVLVRGSAKEVASDPGGLSRSRRMRMSSASETDIRTFFFVARLSYIGFQHKGG